MDKKVINDILESALTTPSSSAKKIAIRINAASSLHSAGR